MKKILLFIPFLIFVLELSTSLSFAESQYVFNCDDSKIKGSIKYSVIGRYHSDFKECSGMIIYDKLKKEVKHVQLEIKTKSIHSDCEWCDKVVVSKQLLDADRYPLIVFNGKDFEREADGYRVKGVIDLHGVKKVFDSQFSAAESGDGNLYLKGAWVLRRKDFNITWNAVLDHGGVLVGDHITVDWEIQAKIQ